jgi:late competence protein required for DNA uptake (superfamily II DNA/RNA helicase)
MIPCRAIGIDYEKEKVSMVLLNWIAGKEKILNIVSVPYNSSVIFMEVILRMASEEKKILYITEETEGHVHIIDCIKRFTGFRDYTYVRRVGSKAKTSSRLYITNYSTALKLEDNFELVIYDDTSNFPKYSKYEILELLAAYYRDGSKVICRSVETVFQNARTLDIPIKDCRTPLAEPRIITTRIDVNKDIPYVVYEYLTWSLKSERKVIIFVPDGDKAENVYRYLLNFKESLHNNIMHFKDKSDLKQIQNFIRNKKGIIVMDCINELDMDLKDTDIMVYFADDRVFDYKKLIYFCGKVGKNPGGGSGEVIFLAKDSTKDMETAKEMTRSFNKQAWELGLLRV